MAPPVEAPRANDRRWLWQKRLTTQKNAAGGAARDARRPTGTDDTTSGGAAGILAEPGPQKRPQPGSQPVACRYWLGRSESRWTPPHSASSQPLRWKPEPGPQRRDCSRRHFSGRRSSSILAAASWRRRRRRRRKWRKRREGSRRSSWPSWTNLSSALLEIWNGATPRPQPLLLLPPSQGGGRGRRGRRDGLCSADPSSTRSGSGCRPRSTATGTASALFPYLALFLVRQRIPAHATVCGARAVRIWKLDSVSAHPCILQSVEGVVCRWRSADFSILGDDFNSVFAAFATVDSFIASVLEAFGRISISLRESGLRDLKCIGAVCTVDASAAWFTHFST